MFGSARNHLQGATEERNRIPALGRAMANFYTVLIM